MSTEDTNAARRGSGSNDLLGPDSEAREMAAFVAWAVKKYGQHAYRHTSATSGEWAAWQAARERQPLSQDAVLDFAEGCTLQFHDLLEFARKVERAHGIGA